MRDTKRLTDKIKPTPGEGTFHKAQDNLAQLTEQMEGKKGQVNAEFEPLVFMSGG